MTLQVTQKILDLGTIGVYTPIMISKVTHADLARSAGAMCACGNLRKAARAITQLYDDILRPTGLRVTQFGILGATMAMEPVMVSQLAEATVTDRTTLTRNLKLLANRGLIRMTTGSDRRQREVSLTDRGREALAKGFPFWQQAQGYVVKGLGEGRWKALHEGLSAVVGLTREG